MGTMDPTFNPVITDDSAAFSQKAVQAMEKERSQMQLDDSYQLLAQMTDYKDSPSCKEKQQCSLTEAKDAFREGANKQVMSSQADSLIKISRIWADFCPAGTGSFANAVVMARCEWSQRSRRRKPETSPHR